MKIRHKNAIRRFLKVDECSKLGIKRLTFNKNLCGLQFSLSGHCCFVSWCFGCTSRQSYGLRGVQKGIS